MFRLAVITDEISQDLETVISFAHTWRLQGVELRSVWEKGPFAWETPDVIRMDARLKSEGLAVCGIGAPFYKCDLEDTAARKAHLEGLKRCCAFAHRLGAPMIRGFSFWKGPHTVEEIAQAFVPVEEILKREDMQLVLEPDPGVNTPNGATVAALLREINSKRIGALWDPGNILFDTAGEVPYPDGYEAVRPWLKHVHLKDSVRENGQAHAVPFGTGQVDMEGQLRRLVKDGYNGWVSLEPHYRLNRVLDEATLRLPAGSSFSEGGLAAGTDTMNRLTEKMKRWGMIPAI